jgi:hypothetical protein
MHRSGSNRWRASLLIALFCIVAPGAPAVGSSDESPIEPGLQAQLLLKVLSFDRALAARAGSELTVGVVIQRRYRPSLEAGEDMLAAFASVANRDFVALRVRAVAVELGPETDLQAELSRLEVDVLYVTPVRALPVETIAAATRALRICSMTAVPQLVSDGLAVGVGVRDDRPEILVNLEAASAEGIDFSAQLLRMARIVP